MKNFTLAIIFTVLAVGTFTNPSVSSFWSDSMDRAGKLTYGGAQGSLTAN